MKRVDYIIVGCGLAGIAFSEELRLNNKSFVVFDNSSLHSSTVAAGLYNPVILKRFTEVWKAKAQLSLALPKYKILEDLLQVKLDYKLPVYRRFASTEEQNEWYTASDKPALESFLSTELIKNTNDCVDAEFGYGEVLQTGRIDTKALIDSYRTYLSSESQFYAIDFDYSKLDIKTDGFSYESFYSNYIVFAEGFGVTRNPFFSNLPLKVAKGELITIKAPGLNIDYILKSSVFLVPIGNDLYWVGATYNWKDQSNATTLEGKQELVTKLKKFLNCEFEVVNRLAGIRPTVIDRRPLVGRHPTHKNMLVLNGLGTRGVMIAPYVAEQLYKHVENGTDLDPEIYINRFIS